jgi:hypothetical protein
MLSTMLPMPPQETKPLPGGDGYQPPPAGSIAEMIETAKAVGYRPGVPDCTVESCREI